MDIVILGVIMVASSLLILSGVMLFISARINHGARTNNAWILMGFGLIISGTACTGFQFVPPDYALLAAAVGATGTLLILIGAVLLRKWMKVLTA